MKTPMTWLLAGAALTLCAGAGVAVAAADPADTIAQAQADARAAAADADQVRADAAKARADAQQAREEARRIRDEARVRLNDVRVHRHDGDGVYVIRGGDRAETMTTMLQLRPEQEPALKTFLEATQPRRDGDHDRMIRFQREDDSRTTLQRLDDMQARAATQKAEMDRKVAAIRTFYGQLDAKQKKAFDAMPMLMMVGPNIGPMMIPGPMHIGYHFEGPPPVPPVPPTPPIPPRSPRS